MKPIDKNKILLDSIDLMVPKIKKSLFNTNQNEREDLEQEIKLKIIEAVVVGKIGTPPTFSEFVEEVKRK